MRNGSEVEGESTGVGAAGTRAESPRAARRGRAPVRGSRLTVSILEKASRHGHQVGFCWSRQCV